MKTELTQTATRRGFKGIRCPLCGSDSDTQTLELDNLDTFLCAGCDEDYTADDLRQAIAAWQRVLAWIDAAPAIED
jgi:hypothetical protein